MDDDELEKLREQKRNEIQQNESGSREESVEQQKQQLWSEAKKYMSKEASSRLSNIKAVNEELAFSVAQQIAMLGDSGRIEKVDDAHMKQILTQIKEDNEDDSDIKFRR